MENEQFVYWNIQDQQNFVDLEWLSPSEYKRQQSFRFPKRKKDWLSGRWAAKNLLINSSSHLQRCQLSEFSIENNPDGSPLVTRNGELLPGSISISHRSDYASTAWTANPRSKIGIDLEVIEPKPVSFIDDFFTINEFNFLFEQKLEDHPVISSLIWSAKEAVMKALQTGLRLDTRQIEIHIPTFEENNGWNKLELSTYPGSFQSTKLFFKRIDPILITMAVFSSELIDDNNFPMNFIQVNK